MGKIYHWHADVGAFGAEDCGTINGHDASCTNTKFGLTTDNENDCDKMAKGPEGTDKNHKCFHTVPDAKLLQFGTDQQIEAWVSKMYCFVPKADWIIYCKEIWDVPVVVVPGQHGSRRIEPCPMQRRAAIKNALVFFRWLDAC